MTTGNSDKTAWLTVCDILLFVAVTKSLKAVSNLDWKNKMQEKKSVLFPEMKQFLKPLEAEKVNISLCCYKRFSIAPKCTRLVKY